MLNKIKKIKNKKSHNLKFHYIPIITNKCYKEFNIELTYKNYFKCFL